MTKTLLHVLWLNTTCFGIPKLGRNRTENSLSLVLFKSETNKFFEKCAKCVWGMGGAGDYGLLTLGIEFYFFRRVVRFWEGR